MDFSFLSDEQKKVVFSPFGSALVLAGAGSGKTKTLVYRFCFLIKEGIPPQKILLLTFTQKAAQEMLSRTKALLSKNLPLIGGTFHHIGNVILREYANFLGLKKDFSILDEEDKKILIKKVLEKKHLKKDFFPKPEKLAGIFSLKINELSSFDEVLKNYYPQFKEFSLEIEECFKEYNSLKRELNYVDFDDLLYLWYELLKIPSFQKEIEKRFFYILVDEYQDTNFLQHQIIKKMRKENKNLMVVGDDAQSIYSFRGARISNILNFKKDFPSAKIYFLKRSFRVPKEVLSFSNELIKQSRILYQKNLFSEKSTQAPILYLVKDEIEEAEKILDLILNFSQKFPLNEIAILTRTAYQTSFLEMMLHQKGIFYIKRGGMRFFESAHIKDVLAFLKIEKNPLDEISWQRILLQKETIGPKTAQKIINFLKKHFFLKKEISDKYFSFLSLSQKKALSEVFGILEKIKEKKDISEKIEIILKDHKETFEKVYDDFEERKEDILSLISFAQGKRDLGQFLEEIVYEESFQSEFGKEKKPSLLISTIHQAKGLEWEVVILMDVVEGYLPHFKSGSEKEIEEERRLFYVASTRTKNYLFLFCPLFSKRHQRYLEPSRFLKEVPPSLFEIKDLTLKEEIEEKEIEED